MELYPDDLRTMINIMGYVEDVANVEGVSDIEIKVRINDEETWTVLGYGESGDPCVLRFEAPIKPVIVKPNPFTINREINQIPCGEWPQNIA